MAQEFGETRDAIIEDDQKLINDILNANKDRKDPYWIVLCAKPSKFSHDGKPVLVKHVKPYGKRPMSQVGMVIAEVNNQKGTVKWEINMPQVPFDYGMLQLYGAKPCNDVVTETTTIPGAYITQ